VSLKTGAACSHALASLGYRVRCVDWQPRDLAAWSTPPDVVFLALHGSPGEDGTVQGFLEVLGIPYTGPGVACSALAIDKTRTKEVLRAHGVPTPDWVPVHAEMTEPPFLPCFVKPAREGSSVGLVRVTGGADWARARAEVTAGRGLWMAEREVSGLELTVGVWEDRILGDVSIVPAGGVFDFAAKYERNDTRYSVPAAIDAVLRGRCHELALRTAAAVGARGVVRVDVMVGEDGPQVLEVNTLPGMTATSLVPRMAAAVGWTFPRFVEAMLEGAALDAEGWT
jgi:D-alanine-D-alanine ligase